eukprot:CAMPEP_0201106670 /NCGR_PEP_ID=MMETSP0812-20130820/52742_1 /ASSEMBLY_ACC=CAM_ASM_000668 /TAXON_ID=98059 /ORGANISM="Dinobryon sp., Strain UTEXLB2267" /LENGTH=78 /DNA_ID=CAMNT_0047367125 /DNA_START=38 /DNA_END=271 /DNA_ORIENTATION=-
MRSFTLSGITEMSISPSMMRRTLLPPSANTRPSLPGSAAETPVTTTLTLGRPLAHTKVLLRGMPGLLGENAMEEEMLL